MKAYQVAVPYSIKSELLSNSEEGIIKITKELLFEYDNSFVEIRNHKIDSKFSQIQFEGFDSILEQWKPFTFNLIEYEII